MASLAFVRGRVSRRPTGQRHAGWRTIAFAGTIAALALLPLGTIILSAATGGFEDWPHLAANVVPLALRTTILYLAGITLLCVPVGVGTAYLVASFDFPGRGVLQWLLAMPLAVPPYLAAYAFVEFLDYSGPVQTLLRDIFHYRTARDYWFFEVRSLAGSIFVLSFVLYPYVYLTCRALFLVQGRTTAEVARTLGSSRVRTFLRIQLPMARPAIAAGSALALMEALNDIGAVEYLGVTTLAFSVFDTWLNRGSLAGAAQIAAITLVVVLGLVATERWARRQQRFYEPKGHVKTPQQRPRLTGAAGYGAGLLCALPVLIGFGIPLAVLGGNALRRTEIFYDGRLLQALASSITIAAATAALTVVSGFVLVYAVRRGATPALKFLNRLATFGYAMPGTVVALGVLVPLAALDNAVDGTLRSLAGISTGLLLTGSGAAIIYACSIRFLALAEGAVDAGFQKISPNLGHASRALGRSSSETLRLVILPLLQPALLTAGLIVFVDTLKELSATILLRPIGLDTLATLVYEDASRGAVEKASVPAMIIIAAGCIPVLLLTPRLGRNGG